MINFSVLAPENSAIFLPDRRGFLLILISMVLSPRPLRGVPTASSPGLQSIIVVNVFEEPKAGAGIGGEIDNPDFLPGSTLSGSLADFLGEFPRV